MINLPASRTARSRRIAYHVEGLSRLSRAGRGNVLAPMRAPGRDTPEMSVRYGSGMPRFGSLF